MKYYKRNATNKRGFWSKLWYNMRLISLAIVFAFYGTAVIATAVFAGYMAYKQFGAHDIRFVVITLFAVATALPALFHAGRGLLKDGVFNLLTKMAERELAKKESE